MLLLKNIKCDHDLQSVFQVNIYTQKLLLLPIYSLEMINIQVSFYWKWSLQTIWFHELHCMNQWGGYGAGIRVLTRASCVQGPVPNSCLWTPQPQTCTAGLNGLNELVLSVHWYRMWKQDCASLLLVGGVALACPWFTWVHLHPPSPTISGRWNSNVFFIIWALRNFSRDRETVLQEKRSVKSRGDEIKGNSAVFLFRRLQEVIFLIRPCF